MTILNSHLEDIPEIFRLYQLATEYQKIKFPKNQWPVFDLEFVTNEVEEKRQFKILIEHQIACIWAITYTDPQIWEGSDGDAAIYIHRIATNPMFRGNNFVQRIVDWSKVFARERSIQFIRMDTGGRNERLISHYKSCGFEFLGMKKLSNFAGLPAHYHNVELCFFEIKLTA